MMTAHAHTRYKLKEAVQKSMVVSPSPVHKFTKVVEIRASYAAIYIILLPLTCRVRSYSAGSSTFSTPMTAFVFAGGHKRMTQPSRSRPAKMNSRLTRAMYLFLDPQVGTPPLSSPSLPPILWSACKGVVQEIFTQEKAFQYKHRIQWAFRPLKI